MVLSCLVEPLVSPLIGQGTSGPRRTSLTRTRLLATAIAVSALVTLSSPASGAELQLEKAPHAAMRNAHQKPAPKPYREMFAAVLFAWPRDEFSFSLAVSPSFEQAA